MDRFSLANGQYPSRRLRLLGYFLTLMMGWEIALNLPWVSAVESTQVRIPLPKLAPVETTKLQGMAARFTVKIPIPARWEVEGGKLHFSFVNSTALLAQNSRLVVSLNGRPLAQVTLQPTSPVGEVTVALPRRLLSAGYHDLEFSVSQHYTLDCEFPTSPELWTTLELDRSYIDLTYRMKRLPLALSAITEYIVDPRLATSNEINLVIPALFPDLLELAAIVASGIAVRFDYRPIHFTLSHTLRPGVDNILLGDESFIDQAVGKARIKRKGSYLELMHLRTVDPLSPSKVIEDPTRALIIAGGENREEMRLAAFALASMSFPYPGTAAMEVREIRFPSFEGRRGKNFLFPEKEYSFQQLGLDTHTFQGIIPPAKELAFRIPTEWSGNPNRFAKLVLHLAYGSGLRKDSVFNIFLNGKFLSSIFLDNPQGGSFRNYQIPIPAYLFKKGRNVFTFSPVMSPLVTGYCEFIQTENLLLTLYGDSSFHMPPMFSWVDLPRLELIFEDGFPFTRFADGRRTTVFLPERNLENAAAALNLLAIMAQKVGIPTFGVRFRFDGLDAQSEEVMAVGPIDKMPEAILKGASIQMSKPGWVPYILWRNLERREGGEASWIKLFLEKILPPPPAGVQGKTVQSIESHQVSGLGPGRIVLSQFQSPFKESCSILLLTGESGEKILEGARALWEPSVQARLRGDLAIVDLKAPDFPTSSLEVKTKYYIGDLDRFSRISMWFYNRPWVFALVLVLAFILLALAVFYALRRFRQRRARSGEMA